MNPPTRSHFVILSNLHTKSTHRMGTMRGAAVAAAALLVGAAAPAPAANVAPRPHIVVLLTDNMGWANVGFHRPPSLPAREIHTPHVDELAASGLILDRHYTYKFCSSPLSLILPERTPAVSREHLQRYQPTPTVISRAHADRHALMRSVPLRAAPFLTQHVGTCVPLPLRSADDPTMVPGAGVPVNMTMISSKLKTAGYHSHFIGKWHVGMASRSTQTPQARDFETTLNYFDSGNNYYDSTTEQSCHDPTTKHEVQAVDLWNTSALLCCAMWQVSINRGSNEAAGSSSSGSGT